MIPEIGQFALIVALCIAILQGVVPLAGASLGVRRWVALAVPASLAAGCTKSSETCCSSLRRPT